MTRYLLDTSIISNVIKLELSTSLLEWLETQKDNDLYIASLTVAEIQRSILEKPSGKKRDALDAWFVGPEGPQMLFAGRILPFDERAGLVWAKLMADGIAIGRPRSGLGMIIASVARVNNCIIVTDNERDFSGLEIINPLRNDAR